MSRSTADSGEGSEILRHYSDPSAQELADGEGVKPSYAAGMLRLTLLAPEIIEAIMDGRQADGMSLDRLLKVWPDHWRQQPGACPVD